MRFSTGVRLAQCSLPILLLLAVIHAGCSSGMSTTTKTTPTITWPTPAAITYGTALGASQLNATASVGGSFVYTPAAGTILNAGAQTLSAAFTPADTTKYTTVSATVSLTVNKATPVLTWSAPAAITAGIALSGTQLDATASVPGTFVYNPPAATVLAAGTQTLSVTFTPTDTANYTTASTTVSITVNPANGIGPAGGVVHGFYGASVTVPAGALSTTVDIEIPRDSTGSPTMSSTGVDAAGAMYALTPHGTPFTTPATVQIPFDATRIPTDATPVIYKAEQGGSFSAIPTTLNGSFLSADVANFSWVIPGFASTLPRMVYALTSATVNNTTTTNVSSFKISKGSGALSAETSSAPVGPGAISVTVHPSRRFAYVTNGTGPAPGSAANVTPNSISVYQLDPVTGAIAGPTDTKPVNGNPIAAVVHPTGKFVYVVNDVRFGAPIGNLSLFSIDSTTGALSGPVTTGDSSGAPATAIAFAPSGEFAYVTYFHAVSTPVGNNFWDTVKTYSVDHTTGQLVGPIGSAPTGDNPWAMVITPGAHFGYVASLSNQGNVGQLSSYSIDQTSGVMTLRGSFTISSGANQAPISLAMDSEGRFLYIGLQGPVFTPPNSNFNIQVYSIDPTNGSLTFVSGAATSSNPGGAISVIAEPQAQFLYTLNSDGLQAFAVGSNGTLTPIGAATGVFVGGNGGGGVPDPFFFAASGTSPIWQNGCTILSSNGFAFGGCPLPFSSGGPGSGGGTGGGGTPPPPASTFVLTVIVDSTGGSVISSPAGIDSNAAGLNEGFFSHAFSNGSGVTLTAGPPDTLNAYDVRWTGDCSGTSVTASVSMTQDRHCYVSFTPVSSR